MLIPVAPLIVVLLIGSLPVSCAVDRDETVRDSPVEEGGGDGTLPDEEGDGEYTDYPDLVEIDDDCEAIPPGCSGNERVNSGPDVDGNDTRITPTPSVPDNTTDPHFCMPTRYRGQWWPKTAAGEIAVKKCTLIKGDVTRACLKRKLNLLNHKFGLPFWAEPDYTGCSVSRRDWREDRKHIEPCPYDTSYATVWVETQANETATASCPSTMDVNNDNLVATRRCEAHWYGGSKLGVWMEPNLVDCVVAMMDSKVPPKEETVVINLDAWVNDNSCTEDETNSTTGSFQWNTTIVGGIDVGTCPYGSLIPPPEVIDFIKFSLTLAAAFIEMGRNVSRGNHTFDGDYSSRRNETDSTGRFLTNETLREIKSDLINRTIELLEDFTFGHVGDDSGSGRAPAEDEKVDKVSAMWSVDIAKAVDRMEKTRGLDFDPDVPHPDVFEIMQIINSLPGSALDIPPMLPALEIETGKILLDLRGIDPVVTAVDTLWKMEAKATMDTHITHRERRGISEEIGLYGDEEIPEGPGFNEDEDEGGLLYNITSILEALEAAAKNPTRKCEENGLRKGVIWTHADTWMCRSANASYTEDIVRVLDESGYLGDIQEAFEKTGNGEKIDGSLIRIVLKMWEAFELWRQTRQKSKMTINAIQAISYLISLDAAVLPPWLSQQIVQMIEDMANEPLPDDVTAVDIVTENVVVNIGQVEKADFRGITFASVGPNSVYASGSGNVCDLTECTLGDNIFMRLEGDLNNTLDYLDMEAVDEYFYLPQNIFNMSAHSIQNHTYCNAKDENISVSTNQDTTPLLQFVLYENDQLFRTKSGEVPVVLPDSYELNGTRNWQVATRVISGTLGGYCMSGLPQPVVFLMEHRIDISGSEHRLCVYWDYNERGGLGAWSTSGCHVYISDSDQTTCQCNHLTNFAVIVDIWAQLGKGRLPDTHDVALEIISIVGCTLSLIGLLVTIICLLFVKRLRESKTMPTRLMLCITLFIAMLFLLVGMDKTADPAACAVFAFFIHYFTLTSLMWMGVEAVFLYRNIVAVVINPKQNFFHYCCGVAWGIPAVICVLTAIMNWDAYGDENRCWISDVGVFFGAFLAPVLVIVTLNFVVFGMVLCVLNNRTTDRIPGSAKGASGGVHRVPARKCKEFMGILSITVLLGLTWIFGAFSVGDGARIIFLYLFTIFNSAQGFFIFIFYCLLSLMESKKSRSSHHRGTCSTDKMTSPSAGQGSAKRLLHVQVNGDEMKTGDMMANLMAAASYQDIRLEVGGKGMADDLKGQINSAFCLMDEDNIHKMTSAGDLASKNDNTTMLGIVMSARLVHMQQSRSTEVLKSGGEGGKAEPNKNAGLEEPEAPEFVISTGIIFGGNASQKRGSVSSAIL